MIVPYGLPRPSRSFQTLKTFSFINKMYLAGDSSILFMIMTETKLLDFEPNHVLHAYVVSHCQT